MKSILIISNTFLLISVVMLTSTAQANSNYCTDKGQKSGHFLENFPIIEEGEVTFSTLGGVREPTGAYRIFRDSFWVLNLRTDQNGIKKDHCIIFPHPPKSVSESLPSCGGGRAYYYIESVLEYVRTKQNPGWTPAKSMELYIDGRASQPGQRFSAFYRISSAPGPRGGWASIPRPQNVTQDIACRAWKGILFQRTK